MSTRRSAAALLAAAAVAVGGLTALTASAAQAAPGCKVDYKITSQWTGGFGADVTITNLGRPDQLVERGLDAGVRPVDLAARGTVR